MKRKWKQWGASLFCLFILGFFLVATTSPGLWAQDDTGEVDGRLLLSSIDSSDFPQVLVKLHAVDSNGLPASGLTATDFLLVEDHLMAPADAIVLTGDTSAPLLTALVLDRSTDPASWSAIQNAVSTFIDGLAPGDQAALVVYGDDVQVAQDFTGDKARLKEALAATTAGGSFSAVNLGVQEGLDLMADHVGGRRAVIVVADRADNLAASPIAPAAIPTIAELVEAAYAAGATVDVLGYGANAIASSDLRALARRTAGRSIFSTLPVELASHLQAMPPLLRQGYLLRYRSQLPAAGDVHYLTTALVGRAAPVSAPFVSRAQPVQVRIARLGDGPPSPDKRVSGAVIVGVEADAPSAVASVTFLLDGSQVITATDQMIGGIVWDTTQATPGPHKLTVIVDDEAGNSGQAEATLLVVPPITLDVAVSDDNLVVGETAVITAVVESFFGDTVVEAFVGVNLVGLVTNPVGPARFEVDTGRFAPGRYALVVRARDGMGYSALSDQTIFQFAPAAGDARPTSAVSQSQNGSQVGVWVAWLAAWWSVWWPWLAGILLALFTLWFFVAIVRRLRRRRTEQATRVQESPACRILITNEGNAASRFYLRAEEPEGTLSFRFSVDGVWLQTPAVMAGEASAILAPPAPALAAQPAPQSPQTKQTTQPAAQTASALASTSKSVFRGVGAFMYVASVAVELLNGLSSFLPSFLASPLQQAAGALRQRQMMVRHTQTQVAMTTTEVKQTAGAGRELAGMASKTMSKVAPAPAASQPGAPPTAASVAQLTPVTVAPAVTSNGAASGNGAAPVAPRPTSTWVETPLVAPGETLSVDVHISSAKRLGKEKRVAFRLHSRAAGQENVPPQVEDISVNLDVK